MRAYSFRQAIKSGHDPREYQDPVPQGECVARLDFKMWGKGVNLRCFFTSLEDGRRFSLSAYRFHDGIDFGEYCPRDLDIDFSTPGIEGKVYCLVTSLGPRGGTRWEEASEADKGTGVITGVQ